VREIFCRAGDIVPSGSPFMRIETADASQAHLKVNGESSPSARAKPVAPPPPPRRPFRRPFPFRSRRQNPLPLPLHLHLPLPRFRQRPEPPAPRSSGRPVRSNSPAMPVLTRRRSPASPPPVPADAFPVTTLPPGSPGGLRPRLRRRRVLLPRQRPVRRTPPPPPPLLPLPLLPLPTKPFASPASATPCRKTSAPPARS
jgi:pyruvate/2-oxoglutarate dehydrogenase complex dihydrolipoamide acyltransferase (E2) component